MSSDDYFLKLKRNQVLMIRDRGYDISDEEWILDVKGLTGKKFKKKLLKKYEKDYDYPLRKLMFSEYHHPHKDKPLFIYYVCIDQGKQIKVETVKPFIHKMTEENKDGLLVIDSPLSPTAAECFSIITEHHYQIFKEEDLLFNVISHIQCDVHVLCTEAEVSTLKKKGVSGKGLLWLLHTDPIAQYYGFPIGSYVKIIVYIDVPMMNQQRCHYRVVV